LDEIFAKINGRTNYLWRAVDHEGEALESFVSKRRFEKIALKFATEILKRHDKCEVLVTDQLRVRELLVQASAIPR
jgi:putative transposase